MAQPKRASMHGWNFCVNLTGHFSKESPELGRIVAENEL
jgi:hypothetical protein